MKPTAYGMSWRLVVVGLILCSGIWLFSSCNNNSYPVINSLQSQTTVVAPSSSCEVTCIADDTDGGTEVKWIQPDRPLEHCEWLHVGLVFRIPGFIDDVNATVQGYWTVIPKEEPPPPPPPSEVPVGITVMPMDKAELVIPWIVLIGAMLLIVGVSLLIRRRAIR